MKILFSILFFLSFVSAFSINVFAQDVNIVQYLKQIEKGEKNKVEEILPKLKKEYPGNPSVMFLEGILTENGQQAVAIYNQIIQKYPRSRYADAALYRVYSYYYAIGMYGTAKEKLEQLQKDYPQSPYIEIAKKNIPEKDNEISSSSEEKDSVQVQVEPDTASVTENGYSYTIQAGAFGVLSNAESLSKSFKNYGYFTKIEDKAVGGTTLHIVYVGRFTNEDDANKMLQLINSKFNLNGRVIKTN